MLLFNNSRISDAKERLRSEMQILRTEIQKDLLQLRLDFTERFNSIDRKLDELLKLAADHDQRITRLESRT